MKLGSWVFLLFFACAAPVAPVIAQCGSAVFIFLLLLLSPFIANSSKPTAELPEKSSPIYCQIDDDLPANELIIFQSSHRQTFHLNTTPTAEKPTTVNIPQPGGFTARIIEYLNKKPEKTYSLCQPVRAGPVFIIA